MRKVQNNLPLEEFGIAGGFSALKPITETIFPKYYPLLLSHLPPMQNIVPPRILPTNWKIIKDEILFPYLIESTFYSEEEEAEGVLSLKERCEEWKVKH